MSLIDMSRSFFDRPETEINRTYLYTSGKSLTYADAGSIFRSFAHVIQTEDWNSDTNTIAISTNNQESLLYTIWACVCSGTSLVFCPCSDDVTQIRHSMADTGARILLTDVDSMCREEWAVSLKELMGSLKRANSPLSTRNLRMLPESTEPAFMLQTSGTEGEPKWVKCDFKKCFKVIECMLREGVLDHARDQTVFLTAPLFHSYGLSLLLEYTRIGSTIVLPSGHSPFGPIGELREKSLAHLITAIEGVPYLHDQLSKLAGRISLPSLRHLGYGGGGLDIGIVNQLQVHYPKINYSVRYGMTETPSVVSHKVFRPPYDSDWKSSGRILSIYQIEIVDSSGIILNPEQEGEIIVKGDCIAKYLDSGNSLSEYVLRTGDIGYLTREGELIVVGRKSFFLKHRGFRLSPELIESAIRSFLGVKDCRVLMRDSLLTAEIIFKDDSLSKLDLLSHLSKRLPIYAIPEDIIKVEQIPRTLSGKIKRS